jgi:hypothetical protein
MFLFIKVLGALVMTVVLFVLSVFYLGSAEDWAETLSEGYWRFFFLRFSMGAVASVLFSGLGLALFMATRRWTGISSDRIWKSTGWELLYYLVCSFLMTLNTFMSH